MSDSSSTIRILLVGATGFIGSYVLRALLQAGYSVVTTRRKNSSRTPVPDHFEASGQLSWISLDAHQLIDAAAWQLPISQAQLVINCVGILRQRVRQRYEDVHHHMPAALARACMEKSIPLIHTSALGLHENAKSRFLSSKLRGEQALKNSGADHCIVRPSLIDGLGGFGASWLRMLAASRLHVVPTGATGRFAAVQASDLALAYVALVRLALKQGLSQHREANLGGERLFAYGEYLQLLRGVESLPIKPAWQLPLPNLFTRIGAHLCDLFRFSPFSYGHWILLQRDNLPVPNHLPALLGRVPEPVTYSSVKLRDDFRLS